MFSNKQNAYNGQESQEKMFKWPVIRKMQIETGVKGRILTDVCKQKLKAFFLFFLFCFFFGQYKKKMEPSYTMMVELYNTDAILEKDLCLQGVKQRTNGSTQTYVTQTGELVQC